jgi:hypothetical protein
MQHYSYYFVPVYPYTQTFIPINSPQTLQLPQNVPLTANSPTFSPHPNDHAHRTLKPLPAEDPEERSNHEARSGSPQPSLRLLR